MTFLFSVAAMIAALVLPVAVKADEALSIAGGGTDKISVRST